MLTGRRHKVWRGQECYRFDGAVGGDASLAIGKVM